MFLGLSQPLIKSKDFLIIDFLIFSIVSCNFWAGSGQSTFDLLSYGAKGDGHSDDSLAFAKAWEALCRANQSTTIPTLVVPEGYTFFLSQKRLKGPCRSNQVHVQILGNLLAPVRKSWGACSRHWLYFVGVHGMTIDGSGVINGQGQDWWGRNLTDGCKGIPTALLFERCNGLRISGLTHINGPGSHIFVTHSQNISISHINVTSPEDSHNTDGIDISNSKQVDIHDSIIGTGDDCIAIKGGTQFLNVSRVQCGPGHGISVGSLGQNEEEESVSDIHVWNCSINGATGGAKIKTWPGGRGYVKRITFEHIIVNQTNYSVNINQHYFRTPEKPQAIKVSDVTFKNIQGTCTNKNAIVLDCANIGCSNITLSQINITSIDPKKPASTICNYVEGKAMNVSPYNVSCFH